MSKKHLTWFLFLFFLIILALLLTVVSQLKNGKQITNDKSSPNIFSDKSFTSYANFAKENGPQKAYQLLKEKFPDNNPSAHDFAHVIGISAYEQLGPSGLSICDNAYNYGCYHGFIEAFLLKVGTKAIVDIEKSCLALGPIHAPSCLHGIGHGVLAQHAYKLNESLKDCDIMQETNRLYCWDGVFMERVSGSMQSAKDRALLTSKNLLEPCDAVAQIYKNQCWRNQVTSWLIYFKNDTKEVGKMCLKVEKEHQKTCFESIGLANVMKARENQSMLLELCKILPNNSFSDDCLIGELKELLFEGKSASVAQSLCNYTSQTGKQECFSTFKTHYEQSRLRFGS